MMQAILYRRFLVVFCVLSFLTAACALPNFLQSPPSATPVTAVETTDPNLTQPAADTPTGEATSTPGLSAPVAQASDPTLRPSSTPIPTATNPVVIPKQVYHQACDQAGFVSDLSIPDGTVLTAGMRFEKTWRIKNTGTCTWTADYAVVFASGKDMNGPDSQSINQSVKPGETVDISVSLQAPGEPGEFRSDWKMRNAAGEIFGVGPSRNKTFYVDIKVQSATTNNNNSSGYNFTSNYCAATWTGSDQPLACLGTDGSADGFILYIANPILENGYVDNEPALLTQPPLATGAEIRGEYPAYTVKAKDHFAAIIGCEHNAKNCNVRFQLDYQIDNGAIHTLAGWNESYDGHYSNVDVDLSSLVGKNVKFILTVLANGVSDQNRALWLQPRIISQTNAASPTPTKTPNPTATPTESAYPYPYP